MPEDPSDFRGSGYLGYAPRPEAAGQAPEEIGFSAPERAFLAAVVFGSLLTTADIFLALLTLPVAQQALGSSDGAIQMAVAMHSAAFAAVLIPAGRLGDAWGAHRVSLLGLAVMSVAAALAASAPTTGMLILARVLQGVAAGLVMPQVIALVGTRFAGQKRRVAFAAFAIAQALGGIFGQMLAGALIQADLLDLGWRAPFALLLPLALLGMGLTAGFVDERRAPRRRPLDGVGMTLCAACLTVFIWCLTLGRTQLQGPQLLGGLSLALGLGMALAAHQLGREAHGGDPMLPLSLLRSRRVRLGMLAALVFYMGVLAFYWVVSMHLQRDLRFSPLEAGAMFALYGLGFTVATALGPRLAAFMRSRVLQAGAWIIVSAHLIGFLATQAHLGTAGVIAYLVIAGLGIGTVMAPLLAIVTAEAPHGDAGALSGVYGTVQAAGNGIGASVVPIAYFSGPLPVPGLPETGGFAGSLSVLLVLALVLVWLVRLLRSTRRSQRGLAVQPGTSGA